MTATALATVTTQTVFPTGQEFTDMRNAAALISQSGLVPEAFRGKPADVLVAILTARGLGLDPMVALQKGYVVKGKFDIEVSVKLGLVQSRVPDYDFEIIELNDERCIIEGGRAGKNRVRSQFTYAQAVAAGLTVGKFGPTPTWQFYRQDMLLNRALGRNLKLTCAAALYNMPLRLDEPDDEVPPPAPPDRERSGAEVLDGPVATPAAPVQPAESIPELIVKHDRRVEELQREALTTPLFVPPTTPVSQPVPVDWPGRLLNAIRAHYQIKAAPPDAVNGRGKWVKANEVAVLRIVSLFYEEKHEPGVTSWMAVPPMDYERIAVWLEGRAGAVVPRDATGGKDAAPATNKDAGNAGSGPASAPAGESMAALPASEPEMPDGFFEQDDPGPPEAAEPPLIGGYEALAKKGMLHMLTVFDGLRMASAKHGDKREFYKRDAKKRPFLYDGTLLTDIGSLAENNAPKCKYLDEIVAEPAQWMMLARAVWEECNKLNVSYL